MHLGLGSLAGGSIFGAVLGYVVDICACTYICIVYWQVWHPQFTGKGYEMLTWQMVLSSNENLTIEAEF